MPEMPGIIRKLGVGGSAFLSTGAPGRVPTN